MHRDKQKCRKNPVSLINTSTNLFFVLIIKLNIEKNALSQADSEVRMIQTEFVKIRSFLSKKGNYSVHKLGRLFVIKILEARVQDKDSM